MITLLAALNLAAFAGSPAVDQCTFPSIQIEEDGLIRMLDRQVVVGGTTFSLEGPYLVEKGRKWVTKRHFTDKAKLQNVNPSGDYELTFVYVRKKVFLMWEGTRKFHSNNFGIINLPDLTEVCRGLDTTKQNYLDIL